MARDSSNWKAEYQRKLVSAEEAAKLVKSGDRVVLPCGFHGVTPQAMIARRQELKDVEVRFTSMVYDPGWFAEDMTDSFNLICATFLNPIARPAHDDKRVDFLPFTTFTWWKTYRDQRPEEKKIDVFITQISPPDGDGYCSYGDQLWERRQYARLAKIVIGDINYDSIRTFGDNRVHVSEIDYFVEGEPAATPPTEVELEIVINALPEERRDEARKLSPTFSPLTITRVAALDPLPTAEQVVAVLMMDRPDTAATAIAANLKTILRDRDTIQIGVGRPSKWMAELGVFDDLHDLSIFSEMGCPGMAGLVERGIANGKYATLHPGKAVFTGFGGFRYDEIQYANDNPAFELYGSDYVIDISNIAANDNMVSINNGLQIDLIGQITCETQFGARLINGPGGQIDFHFGAFLSKGGRAVTLLPSTALQGSLSTIVAQLNPGTMVDIPRTHADIVITEYGIARLAGRPHRERAEELASIAHPDHRAELREAAKTLLG